MKKMLIALVVGLMVFSAIAIAGQNKMNKGKMNHLYLYEKDQSDWSIIEGAWGKLNYDEYFVFNGHGLEAGEAYNLINFARVDTDWPATINNLAEGTVNPGGNIHIKGTQTYEDLKPDETDDRFGTAEDGAKIWLVITGDIFGGKLDGWTPKKYLFEGGLIKLPI